MCKPYVHLCRLAGPERLRLVSTATAEELPAAVSAKLFELVKEAGCNATRLDNLLWLFCACGYGAICNANPKCGVCRLRLKCREGRDWEGLSALEC